MSREKFLGWDRHHQGRYEIDVVVDAEELGVNVFHRDAPDAPFLVGGHLVGEMVALPEIGVELSVDALYGGILAPPASDGGR